MAYYKFARAIMESKPIEVYNHGDMSRDFTYIDDIVDGVVAAIEHLPSANPTSFALYNLGNNQPENLMGFIETLEKHLGHKAEKIYCEMQPGDVPATMADIEITQHELGWEPKTIINDGLKLFAEWFKEYNGIS